MKIEINIKNRHVLIILLFIIAASAIGLVIAYGGNQPSIMGHTWGEMVCDNTLCANPVNGNVGIGTQNPTEKLEVNGFIKTGSGIKFPDGTIQDTASVSGFFQSYSNKLFGTGADGDVVISANTVLPAGTGGVKVMNYNNLVINSGVNLASNPADKVLVILVKNRLTINGNITMNGRGGTGGTGGGGGAGAAGGGSGSSSGYPGGGGGYAGGFNIATIPFIVGTGAGGVVAEPYGGAGQNYMPSSFNTPMPFMIARYLYGGGGGGDYFGSGGGNGGGIIWIEAKEIEWGASGLVLCNGNNGGTSSGYGAGGGGGGFCQVAYKTKIGISKIQANGGLGGAVVYYGGPGAAGSTGEFQVS